MAIRLRFLPQSLAFLMLLSGPLDSRQEFRADFRRMDPEAHLLWDED
jgi:hypothetical protein